MLLYELTKEIFKCIVCIIHIHTWQTGGRKGVNFMKILISNSSDQPLYMQIKEQLKDAILREELKDGDSMPSIRRFANDLGVSVLTIRRVYDEGKFVAAICAAPSILAKLGITDGRKATCYPGFEPKMGSAVMQSCGAVRDGTVITGRAAGSSEEFGLLLLEALKGKAAAEKVAGEIVYSR